MFKVFVKRNARNYLASLSKKEHQQCYDALVKLGENPFRKRSGCDIKKKGGEEEGYRLRVGKHRFNYWVGKSRLVVTVEEGFQRERGYR